MAWVFNPETGKDEWAVEAISPSNTNAIADADAERLRQSEIEKKQASLIQDTYKNQPITAVNLDNENLKSSTPSETLDQMKKTQRENLSQLGADLSSIENNAAPAPKATGYVSELATGYQLPQDVKFGTVDPFPNVKPFAEGKTVVSQAEGMNRPISAQEVISRTSQPILTSEQQQARLLQLRNQVLAREQVKYDNQRLAKQQAIAPTGIMDGDRAKMFFASTNKTATPYTLNAKKNAYDAASGASTANLAPDQLQIALQPISKIDPSTFGAKGKAHITGFSQEADASYMRFKSAVQNDFTQGKAKADAALAGLGRTPTLKEWNDIVDKSYSNVTRDTARMAMPQGLLENLDVVEANRTPFAASIVRDNPKITPEEANKFASQPDLESTPEYKKFVQAQEPGSFYKDEKGKPQIRTWSEGQYKAEAAKQATAVRKEELRSGAMVDAKDSTVKSIYKENGFDYVNSYNIQKESFDPNKRWTGNKTGNVVIDGTDTAVADITTKAEENFKTKKATIGDSIDSAMTEAIDAGTIRNVNDNSYASIANKVYKEMSKRNDVKDKELRAKIDQQLVADVGGLYDRLVTRDSKGEITGANENTFGGLTAANSLGYVSKNFVNAGNIDEKTKELLLNTIDVPIDSVAGNALNRQLSLDPTQMSPEVGAAYDKVRSYLQSGLFEQAKVQATHNDIEEQKQLYRNEYEAIAAKNGKIVDWNSDGNGNFTPVEFKSVAEHDAWKRMTPEQRQVDAMQKKKIAEDYAVKKVDLNNELTRLKRGEVKIPIITQMKPDVAGNPTVPVIKDKYVQAASEEEFDAGEDYLYQNYGDHQDLLDAALKEFNAGKQATIDQLIKQNKWETPSFWSIKGVGASPNAVSIDKVRLAFEEVADLTSSEADVDRLNQLDKEVPGIKKYALSQNPEIARPLGKPILKANTEKKLHLQFHQEKNGYKFKGGNPNDKNNWEKI